MKKSKSWYILLLIWVALVFIQLGSNLGIFPFGKLPAWLCIIGGAGIGNCMYHIKKGD